MANAVIYEHFQKVLTDLIKMTTNMKGQIESEEIRVTELQVFHDKLTFLFKHCQQCENELMQMYVSERKVMKKIEIEIEYMKNKLIHQSDYEEAILLQQYKELMLFISSEFNNHYKMTPRQMTKPPFLVSLWTTILIILEKISVFYVVRNFVISKKLKANHRFVDYWLLAHTILAVIYVVVAAIDSIPILVKYIFLAYSCMRMFEILIYQLNVILVHPYNTINYALNSYRRMTIALLHNFFEIIFWFAGTFITLKFVNDLSVPLAVYTSFIHMVTYSMDLDKDKWTLVAILVLQFQAVIGVFMTVLSLARFISLFPQPMSMDPAEQEANELRHDRIMKKLCEVEAQVNKNKTSIQQIEEVQGSVTEASARGEQTSPH